MRIGKKPGKTMEQVSAEERLQASRTKCTNSVHLAVVCLGQPGAQRRGKIIIEVGRPIFTAFSKEVEACKSPKETARYHFAFAATRYKSVLQKVMGLSTDPGALARAQFDLSGNSGGHARPRSSGAASSSSSDPPRTMEALDVTGSDKEGAEFASLLFRLCCNVCARRSMSMQQCYSALPPGIFAMLRKRDAVAAALQELKAMWQVITGFEVLANANPALASVMRNVPFFLNPVVRDIFVLLSQHGFLLVPPAVTKMLRAIFDGFCQTVLVERAFQKLQDRRRPVRNNKIRRMKRFYNILSSGLLGEMGRREVGLKSGPLPSPMPRVVPKTCFEAKGLSSSIPDMWWGTRSRASSTSSPQRRSSA